MALGLPRLHIIAGPTASGKTARALALAASTPATIINADSAQVYADLRILTARPSPEEQAQAPHRLFGHIDAADTGYSAARWAGEARAEVAEAQRDGRLPIVVGGTGLYMRTLLDGITPVPAIDPQVRAAVRAMPVAEAQRALAQADPAAAARLHPADTTRVARALEVVRSTGRSLADWQRGRVGGVRDEVELTVELLTPDRDDLMTRIDARAATMLDEGAIEEVAALLARPDLPPAAPIRRVIGVAPLAAYLAGETTREQVLAALQLATRQYAKRQRTWFGNQKLA